MVRRKYCYSEAFQRSTEFWIPSLSIFSLRPFWGEERFEMWELNHKESWEPKNWCFWTEVLEKTLKSPLDCKEIQPVYSEGNQSEYSLDGLMLKLKLQYFGHLMRRTEYLKRPWCWKRLKVGGEGDDRGWDGWMVSLTQWTWVWVNSGSWR